MTHDNCETCGEPSVLVNGMCAPCRARLLPAEQLICNDRLLEVLSRHIGARNGVSVAQLVDEMISGRSCESHASLERAVRDLVVQLRLAGHHICSHPSDGYFMAATAEELDACCNFLYERAMTSLTQVAAMRRVSLPDLRGQLHLNA
ncbi:MAG TPA: hypothetical protein VFS24_06250 [Steroidobacteraceae bacterium]|nr:hypothetical protein [Steroidobacteraceae bacterium]